MRCAGDFDFIRTKDGNVANGSKFWRRQTGCCDDHCFRRRGRVRKTCSEQSAEAVQEQRRNSPAKSAGKLHR
jgi:hypothetical protein